MRVMLHSPLELPDASKGRGRKSVVEAGTHTLVEVPNPYGFRTPWLVIEGTPIGAARTWFLFADDHKELPGELHLEN